MGEGLGHREQFELSVAGASGFKGRQTGLLNFLEKGRGVRKEYKQGGGLGHVRLLRLGRRLRGLCRGYKGG